MYYESGTVNSSTHLVNLANDVGGLAGSQAEVTAAILKL